MPTPRNLKNRSHLMFRLTAKTALAIVSLGSALFIASDALATTTVSGSLPVSMTITSECKLQSISSSLQFGSHGVLDSVVDAQASVGVQCTNTTPFNVGLSTGAGSGATVANRLMTGTASATVTYSIYRDAGHTQVWGVTSGTDTLASTGTGAVQSFNIYGRVAVQTTPAPGSYTDTLAVTITY
jgi:spore coat protein U-like protein